LITLLYILQIILCIKLVSVAFTHGLRQDKSTMQEAIAKIGAPARPILMVVAILTLVGAIMLVLPVAISSLSWLTPWSAAILAGILLLSIGFHIKGREKPKIWVSLILCAMAAVVAYGWWMIRSL
jgi:uncharacterized membrane protein YphA (DoxX/SURF4 family)